MRFILSHFRLLIMELVLHLTKYGEKDKTFGVCG